MRPIALTVAAIAAAGSLAGCTSDAGGAESSMEATGAPEAVASVTLAPDIALKAAAVRGDLAALEDALAAGADMDAAPDGVSAVHVAVRWGREEILARLIEAGADLDQAEPGLDSPVHLAAYTGDGTVLEMLIDAGVDPAAVSPNVFGATPAHVAAAVGNVEALTLLESSGAGLDVPDALQETPVTYAVCRGRSEVVAWFEERGVTSQTAPDYCARGGLIRDQQNDDFWNDIFNPRVT